MRFDILTTFPKLFTPFLNEGLISKAQEKGVLEVKVHDLRKWAKDKHKTVDDRPFGGGLGMVIKPDIVAKAVSDLKSKADSPELNVVQRSKVILFTPRGKRFTQEKATCFANEKHIIMICGRYEGMDERVAKFVADEKISMGNYVLMGGELPAMAVLETVARLIPGVVGKDEFLKQRKKEEGFIEYPQYTRPEEVVIEGKKRNVPSVLLSGDHKKIEAWRNKRKKVIK